MPRRRSRHTRIRAVLAGGLVLGIGAAVTLASWVDTEYGTGSFTASTFNTESTGATVNWVSNTASPGATLVFAATAMSPSASHYASLNVRTTAATTVAGTAELTSATTTGTLAAVLEYRAVRAPSSGTTCNAAAFAGSPTWIAGGSSSWIASNTVPGSPVSSAIAAAGGEIRYCFDVRILSTAASSYQGASGTITWLFTTTSNS
jgi:predicted ribosomally synthesized peptide with SipW-like signal peptide